MSSIIFIPIQWAFRPRGCERGHPVKDHFLQDKDNNCVLQWHFPLNWQMPLEHNKANRFTFDILMHSVFHHACFFSNNFNSLFYVNIIFVFCFHIWTQSCNEFAAPLSLQRLCSKSVSVSLKFLCNFYLSKTDMLPDDKTVILSRYYWWWRRQRWW